MLPKRARLNYDQRQVMEQAFTSMMNFCPFFAFYFYDQMEDYPTLEVEMAATDGKRIFYNPEYMATLNAMQRCFALAHEVYHVIYKHPTRIAYYHREGKLKGLDFYPDLFNIAADYVINADLVDSKIGTINPAWLYNPEIKASELAEDVYEKLFKQNPPPPRRSQKGDDKGGGTTGSGANHTPKTSGQQTGRKTGHDVHAQANGGRFDQVLAPQRDAATGAEDVPSEMEFREAVARAEAAAKRAGKMPANLSRVVRDIVDPQIGWKDELRLRVTGKVGHRREDWNHPNRRRIALNPPVYIPRRQGHGAELIAVVIDNSGSIGNDALTVFFSEAAAILNDCRPKKVLLIWADAAVQRVDEARSLDELLHIREAPGGGGTSFVPAFEYLERERIQPDTLVYLTDMDCYGRWPDEPRYPVIWCATTDTKGPFGETVRVRV
jgi:predicted metal-dependent peptidase